MAKNNYKGVGNNLSGVGGGHFSYFTDSSGNRSYSARGISSVGSYSLGGGFESNYSNFGRFNPKYSARDYGAYDTNLRKGYKTLEESAKVGYSKENNRVRCPRCGHSFSDYKSRKY